MRNVRFQVQDFHDAVSRARGDHVDDRVHEGARVAVADVLMQHVQLAFGAFLDYSCCDGVHDRAMIMGGVERPCANINRRRAPASVTGLQRYILLLRPSKPQFYFRYVHAFILTLETLNVTSSSNAEFHDSIERTVVTAVERVHSSLALEF